MSTSAYKRINITLPAATVAQLNRAAAVGDRSGLIADAIQAYLKDKGRAELRKRMIAGYINNRGRDLEIANEWSLLDDAAWFERNK